MDLARLVGQESLETLKGFVVGEANDLADWSKDIGGDAIRAVREGRQDILRELAEQAKVLAEIKRIKTSGFSWEQVVTVFLSLAKVAVQARELKG